MTGSNELIDSLLADYKKGLCPPRDSDWKAALNRFTIQFEDRMPQH